MHIAGSSSAAVSATENVSGTANADSTGFGTNYLRLIIHIGTPMTADCTVAWDGTAPSAVAHANAIVEAKIGTDPNHDGVPDSGKLSAQLFKAVGFPDGTPHASAALDPGDYVVELRQNTDARWITNFHGSPGSATQSSAGDADCTLS